MRSILAYIFILLFVGCAPKGVKRDAVIIEDGKNYYGKKINDHKVVELEEFDVLAKNTDTLYVKLKAGISEVCLEDGCWFRINLHDRHRMIVEIENDAFSIPTDMAGRHVMIEGKTYMQMRTEEEMKRFAMQAGELQWIIDTISGAHYQRTFLATSAVITE